MNSPNNNNNLSLSKKKLFYYNYIVLLFLLNSFGVVAQEIDPNGWNVFHHENGRIASEGNFENGLPVGVWKNYYDDGTLRSTGKKKNGMSDSIWVFYDVEGRKKNKFDYANDMKNGCATFYDTLGNTIKEIFYVDDVAQGEVLEYYADGQIKSSVQYKDGKRVGLLLEYGENGDIITEEIYDNGFLKDKNEYNRRNENGEKIGKWRKFHPNGTIESEIEFENGEKSGISKTYNKKGKLIDLQKMQGDTVAGHVDELVIIEMYRSYDENGKLKLIGGLDNGLKSGIFREYDKEGNIINGYIYEKDTIIGEGIILGNGIYTGEWKTFFKNNGKIKSTGNYNEGLKEGKWTYYYPNGNKEQEGVFKDDLLKGEWKWYYNNGQLKRKEYYNSKQLLEGTVVEYDSLGKEITRGDYYNGRQEGEWFYYVNDFKEVGSYTMGLKDGVWKHYYLNGKLAFIGTYDEGEAKGKHIYYHKNGGKQLVGKYLGGERHGTWKTYNTTAEIVRTVDYKRGEIYKVDGFRVEEYQEEITE